MDFGQALAELHNGKRVARAEWDGFGMWLLLVKEWTVDVEHETVLHGLLPVPWIGMKTSSLDFVPWQPGHLALLAQDWTVIE
jgi:hypothetical protein